MREPSPLHETVSPNRQASLEQIFENENIGEVRSALRIIRGEIENAPVVGREKRPNEIVIPLQRADQKNRLVEAFSTLGIAPWEENALLIVDRRSDLLKLQNAGVPVEIADEAGHSEVGAGREEPEESPFRFPLPRTNVSAFPPRKEGREDARSVSDDEEVSLLDDEIKTIVRAFDEGRLDDDDPLLRKRIGVVPTLKLFPHKYVWEKGNLYHKRDMRPISKDEQSALLKKAQSGDRRALEECVRMNVGLVLYVLAHVRERFGFGVDADDLFQEGLLGLTRAIEKHDPEKGSLAAYASIWIESRMRKYLEYEKQKYINKTPGAKHERRRYQRAEQEIRAEHPDRSVSREELRDALHLEGGPDLDTFERAYVIQNLFDPLDETFEDTEAADEHKVSEGGEGYAHSALDVVEQNVLNAMRAEEIQKTLEQTLRPRERFVIHARFGFIAHNTRMTPEDLRAMVSTQRAEQKERLEHLIALDAKEITPLDLEDMGALDRIILALLGKLRTDQITHVAHDQSSTLKQVGVFLGVSGTRVQGIETRVLRRLRFLNRAKRLTYI